MPKPLESRPVTAITKNSKVGAVKIDLVKPKKESVSVSVSRSSSTARTRSTSNSLREEKIPRILTDLLGPEVELSDC